jgi:hypothetical protein
MPQSGPQPATDKEYLIEIYNIVGSIRKDVEHTATELEKHTARLESLEEKANTVKGGAILLKFGLAAVAPIGVLAGWFGAKLP